MPALSTDTQNAILQRQRDGASITQIAQELGLSRTTVYKSLNSVGQWEEWLKDKSQNINRLALNAVEKSVQRGNAQVAMQWLTRTLLAADPSVTVAGDVTVQQHLTLLPSTTSTPSTAMTTSTAGTTGTAGTAATEAAAKSPGSDIGLSSHTNFSQFSLAELEAEVARRKAGLIEAEVVK